jgi:tetratricopeptide (TPR) repeat protein
MSRFCIVGLSALTVCFSVSAQSLQDCQNGQSEFDSRQFAKAAQSLTACLSLSLTPEVRANILQGRAEAFAELKRYEEALRDQDSAIALEEPRDVWPWVMRSVYHRELKQYDLALADLEKARGFDEDGPGTGPGMAVAYHTGLTYQQMGQHQQAVEAFTAGIPHQPDYPAVYYFRGKSYEALGQKQLAKDDFVKAANLGITRMKDNPAEVLKKLKEYGIPVKPRAH